MLHRNRRPRLVPGALCGLAAALVLGVATAVAGPPPTAGAQDPILPVVEATPVTDVVDGQAIDVRVTMPVGGPTLLPGSRARICRDDASYVRPDDLLPFGPGNCPNAGVSSSATPGGAAGINPLPDGRTAIGTLRAGTGRVQWGPAEDPTRFELTCDTTTPCRLVVEVVTSRGTFIDAGTQVTFADSTSIGACGGADPAALGTAGPDRFIDSWARWTREQCEATGGAASTTAILTGEGLGLDSFATGAADLAYSGLGTAIPGREPAAERAGVSVPLALNAAVIGVLGGYYSEDPDWPRLIPRPFSDVSVTVEEMAALFGQGRFGFSPQPGDATMARNPQLEAVAPLNDPVMAPSGSDVTSYLATSLFDEAAPDAWVTPRVEIEGIPALSPRGPEDELSAADPGFPITILNLYSARANLKQAVASASLVSAGSFPIRWVLTDLATATQLGIPTVALENSRGEMVRPTPESLLAAVPSMEVGDDGSVVPGEGEDAPGAYPLTFVEQAVVPAEPLLDAECVAREDAQALLDAWLAHLTGPGQQQLTGLVPLPEDLAERAVAARDEVGQAPVTGECAPEPPPEEPPAAPPAAPPAGPPGLPAGAPPAIDVPEIDVPDVDVPDTPVEDVGPLDVVDVAAGPEAGAETAEEQAPESGPEDSAEAAEEQVALPDLMGIRSLTSTGGVLVVLAVALMGAMAGPISSGRRPS